MIDYRLGGGVQKGQNIDYVILEWSLTMKIEIAYQCLEQLRPLQHVRIEREHLLEVNVCHPHLHLHLRLQMLWILVAAAWER